MSLEMHVFLRDDSLPSVGEWQAAITRLSLPLQLDLTLEPESMLGFVPCRINDAESGVEMFVDSVSDVVATYPAIASIVHDARRKRTGNTARFSG